MKLTTRAMVYAAAFAVGFLFTAAIVMAAGKPRQALLTLSSQEISIPEDADFDKMPCECSRALLKLLLAQNVDAPTRKTLNLAAIGACREWSDSLAATPTPAAKP